MGIFDKLLGGKASGDLVLDERAAFAAVLLVTVAADGNISDDESRAFGAIVNRMQLFKSQTSSEFSAMMDRLFAVIRREDPKILLMSAAKVLPAELVETAFAIAVDLVLADGSVEDQEKQLLEDLQSALGIRDDFAEKVVTVMLAKNRG